MSVAIPPPELKCAVCNPHRIPGTSPKSAQIMALMPICRFGRREVPQNPVPVCLMCFAKSAVDSVDGPLWTRLNAGAEKK